MFCIAFLSFSGRWFFKFCGYYTILTGENQYRKLGRTGGALSSASIRRQNAKPRRSLRHEKPRRRGDTPPDLPLCHSALKNERLDRCLSVWVFELELVNVANVKISSSNVASFQLGIGIGIGNISTMATFTSV